MKDNNSPEKKNTREEELIKEKRKKPFLFPGSLFLIFNIMFYVPWGYIFTYSLGEKKKKKSEQDRFKPI